LAGKYRLIDIPISNCINSEIRKIFVLTMYQSASLNSHVSHTYRFDHFSQGFVSILAAEQTRHGATWFQGTADAVRKAWVHIRDQPSEHILILSGDHLYRMDYSKFKAVHDQSRAAISIAVQPVTAQEAPELGLLKVDRSGRIIKFVEKPKTPEALSEMSCDTQAFGLSADEAQRRPYLASMGIYYFDTKVMAEILSRSADQTDFGRHIIPQAIAERHVQAYCFDGYWADIGTVGAFYQANMDLVAPVPRFNLFDQTMPIYTHSRQLPGAKITHAQVERSIICDGSIVEGGSVIGSIVGVRSRIFPGARIENSIVMGADHYQSPESTPRIGIGEDALIRNAIIDKDACIGRGVQLINRDNRREYDDPHERFYVRDGVIIVAKDAILPDGLVF
ncbi:MAG TPA: sugar phosphate nucleotidyltransferase, partial [Planctomycetota bacterium]|nr:sugar phosphate nucleotidyltransferase [Planctomycetota bacterium]